MISEMPGSARRAVRSLPRLAAIGARYYLMFVMLQFLLGFVGGIVLFSLDYDLAKVASTLGLSQ
jgi:hypothetical protein